MDLGEHDTGLLELGGVEHAVGAGRLGGDTHEFGLVAKKVELLMADAALLDELDDFAGGDGARVGHIVDTERDALLPARETGANKLIELRERVARFQQALVAHDFGQVIARVFAFVEWDAQSPDVALRRAGEHFFAECLGAAVETAVVLAECEIGRVSLSEPGAVGFGAGVDAA